MGKCNVDHKGRHYILLLRGCAPRCGRRKARECEYRTGDEVDPDVVATERENPEEIRLDKAEKPNDQQDDTKRLAEGDAAGFASPAGQAGQPDDDMHDVMPDVDGSDSEEHARRRARAAPELGNESQDPDDEIDCAEERGDGLRHVLDAS